MKPGCVRPSALGFSVVIVCVRGECAPTMLECPEWSMLVLLERRCGAACVCRRE